MRSPQAPETPQATEAEKALLSCMMLAPDKVIGNFVEHGGREDYFYKHDHLVLYRQLFSMWQAKAHIDHITVTQALEDAGALGKVGGAAYITDVYIYLPAASGWREYADIIREKWIAREAIHLADRIKEDAHVGAKTLHELVQSGLVKISGLFESRAKVREMRDLIKSAFDRAEDRKDNQGKIRGITTGILALDMATRGFRPGQMITIAADTGVGKSALAMQIAKHNASQDKPVAVFSLEMDADELTDRLIANHGEIDMAKVEWGWLKPDEADRFIAAGSELERAPLIIRDEAFMSPIQFQAAARKLRVDRKVQLIIIDYIQLMDVGGSDDNRQVAVARCSRTIKLTAKELGIPVIALSQLTGDSPRDSRAIIQDSDLFLVLEEDSTGDPRDMQIRIKKGRGCEKNRRIPVTFYGESVRFTERAH